MFERGVINGDRKCKIPVILTITDGASIRGTLSSLQGDIVELLGDSNTFLEFTDSSGETSFVSKRSISRVVVDQIPTADQLRKKLGSMPVDNPYAVLGVGPDADQAQCSDAYYALTKVYHPDRLSSLKLPNEIIEYGATMQTRINRAYQQIKELRPDHGNGEPKVGSKPVYERRPHWVKTEAA